jgi:DNA-binding beta-propeller fold protein YncE
MSNNKDFKVKNGIQPTVYHEAVGTVVSGGVGYILAGASYDSASFASTTQETFPLDFFLKPDGTKLYVLGTTTDSVYQYSLSTAWDISTASYDSKSLDVSGVSNNSFGIFFKSDGSKMFFVSGADTVVEYDLSTDWDISTGTKNSNSLNLTTNQGAATDCRAITFDNSGSKLFVVDRAGTTADTIYQYSLSTAWDVSTASYDSKSFNVTSQTNDARTCVFNTDGTKMYHSHYGEVHQYTLATAFDLSTASYDSVKTIVLKDQGTFVGADSIRFSADGTKLYALDSGSDTIYQYSTVLTTASLDLSTGSVFEVTPTSDIQVTLINPAASGTSSGATLLLDGGGVANGYDLDLLSFDQSFSVSGQETQANDVAFKGDGTKMFVLGINGDDVNEYTLSTAWDISTASFVDSFSVATQTGTSPYSIFFKPDGTKFYVMSNTNDRIYQYSMSTAWDISTSSYDNKSHPTDNTNPRHLWFKPDGTVVYYTDEVADLVYGETLTTAWDISTAGTYQSFLDYSGTIGNSAAGVAFNDDGTKVFVIDSASNEIYYWDLSTAWDLTSSTLNTNITIPSISGPQGITFGDSGKKMYLANQGNSIYQYTTGEDVPYTITYPSTIQFSGGTAPTAPAVGDTDVLTFNTTDGGTTYNAALAIDGAS